MADNDETKSMSRLGRLGLTPAIIVQIISIAAVIYGQWVVLNNQVEDIARDIARLEDRLDAFGIRLYAAERDLAIINDRYDRARRSALNVDGADERDTSP